MYEGVPFNTIRQIFLFWTLDRPWIEIGLGIRDLEAGNNDGKEGIWGTSTIISSYKQWSEEDKELMVGVWGTSTHHNHIGLLVLDSAWDWARARTRDLTIAKNTRRCLGELHSS